MNEHELTRRIPIAQGWTLAHFPENQHLVEAMLSGSAKVAWIAATVPGNVVLDLYRAGQIEDPYFGYHPEAIRDLENHEWWYRTEFQGQQADQIGDRLELVCEGMDTFAEIYLDGELLGKTDNMLIAHRFDVTEKIQPGNCHILHVRIRSDWAMVRDRDFNGCIDVVSSDLSRVWIRKAAHAHGWDIFPRMLSAGIWKPIYLESVPGHSIHDLFAYTQKCDQDKASLGIRVSLDLRQDMQEALSVRIRVENDAGVEVYSAIHQAFCPVVPFRFEIEKPHLWWPRPLGGQPMYRVKAELLAGEKLLDYRESLFGIRTVLLCQDPLADGRTAFYFRINGEPVSVFGTNHVSLDALHSNATGRLKQALEALDESGCNMVRVWGGGVYEDEAFYEACDRMGVMVWQDFAFACATYPQQEEFLAQVKQEVALVIKRLRNHPSLVLWCGDNEVAHCCDKHFGSTQTGGNRRIALEVLPDACLIYDGTRPYWPSSPWTGIEGERAGSDRAGDTHIWRHGAYFRDEGYSKDLSPMISEIGHLAFCARESMEQFLPAGTLWPPDNALWDYRFGALNDPMGPRHRLYTLHRSMIHLFGRLPDNLEDMILASQICQAEALKFWIERCRRRKFDCGGILWWNLLDGWPQFSDAVVDYYFRKKLAFHYVQKSQDKVLICMEENENRSGLQVYLVNDTLQELNLQYRVSHGGLLDCQDELTVPANSVTKGKLLALPDQSPVLFLLEATSGDISFANHYLYLIPPMKLEQYKEMMKDIPCAGSQLVHMPL